LLREAKKARLRDYLASHPCVDCGEDDAIVLEFDHVFGNKLRGVTELAATGYSWKIIEEEIGKCEVRCGNCHRKASLRRQRALNANK
jgi:hypothetical protein